MENLIVIDGKGKVFSIEDIAEISFELKKNPNKEIKLKNFSEISFLKIIKEITSGLFVMESNSGIEPNQGLSLLEEGQPCVLKNGDLIRVKSIRKGEKGNMLLKTEPFSPEELYEKI